MVEGTTLYNATLFLHRRYFHTLGNLLFFDVLNQKLSRVSVDSLCNWSLVIMARNLW